jgi:hypothetical protein
LPGQRNNHLFFELRKAAPGCTSFADLLTRAEAVNNTFFPKLSQHEVYATARSVWGYKQAGTLRLPGEQYIQLPIGKDAIQKLAVYPPALALYAALRATRITPTFTIPQAGTAKWLGWSKHTVGKAITVLLQNNLLERVPFEGPRRLKQGLLYRHKG